MTNSGMKQDEAGATDRSAQKIETPPRHTGSDEVTKMTHILERADGSEVRIVAQAMFGEGLHRSVDVTVHRRTSGSHDWSLCTFDPAPDWRSMSVADYVSRGRSAALQAASSGEILRAISAIGRPIADFRGGADLSALHENGSEPEDLRENYPAPRM